MSPPTPSAPTSGFTAIPRRLLDAALCSDMSKRELFLWLLVARLTYGAQGKRWITLRPADLRVIGISSNHARAVLEGMLARSLLVQNGEKPEYRIAAPETAAVDRDLARERQQRLNHLVARQIGAAATIAPPAPHKGAQPSRNGDQEPTSTPKMGSKTFPKEEDIGSLKGNASTVPAWAFSRSHRRFVKKVETPIDNVKTKINREGYVGREAR